MGGEGGAQRPIRGWQWAQKDGCAQCTCVHAGQNPLVEYNNLNKFTVHLEKDSNLKIPNSVAQFSILFQKTPQVLKIFRKLNQNEEQFVH